MGAIFWTVLIGLVAAVVAKLLLPGKNGPHGILPTALVGVAGSYLASFLGQVFGFYESGEYAGFVGSVIGAALLLLIWGWIFRKKPAAP
jgi:uncharacterized membrane protein YeaQ/YmgE (transglycosylase-associated protein family)